MVEVAAGSQADYLESVGKRRVVRKAGPRVAGRVGVKVSVFVWGAREAESGQRSAWPVCAGAGVAEAAGM